jgi:perosamine synthetase
MPDTRSEPLADAVIGALRKVLPGPAPLHAPTFRGREWEYVKECLDTTLVSSIGPFVERMERMLAEQAQVARAVCVVNGTAALQIALKLAGVAHGDEVLCPALTFVATANAISHCGATPHFLDQDPATLGLGARALASRLDEVAEMRSGRAWNRHTGRRIVACVPMHTFGFPVDMDPLLEICRRYGIAVVEDAAEALGSRYKGRMAGSFGRVSALSFNGNKVVTTGGGGAILTDDTTLADEARHLTTTAKVPHPWAFVHDRVGYNYRMPNLNAALGCAQLERLPELLARKRALAERYAAAFAGFDGASLFREAPHSRGNHWLNVLLLDRERSAERDDVIAAANAAGLACRPAWTLMLDLPMYQDCPAMDLPVARDLQARIINLPSGADL